MDFRYRSALILPMAALMVSGCVNIGNRTPPKNLLTLTPAVEGAVNSNVSSQNKPLLLVSPPSVPAELKVTRIPVTTSPTTIAYLTDGVWVDLPSRLFSSLLSDTIAHHNRFMIVSYRTAVVPGYRLSGTLSAFGLDAVHHQVVITYEAFFSGVDNKTRQSEDVISHRFEVRQDIKQQDAVNVAAALNKASNQLADQVASWLDQQAVAPAAS
ncbi:MAG: ABC-type transport auxiliary lipoprotein family protein [Zymomonas mobilis subsp. pomaceae]|uniref:ABC-type transport auxiliary lipoprotein component domain-containing protein n=1 Tax=Zymomonas mobilis subsp. pomaceae (strain ATCC 29192 / DSM 22645 / JCM 10191 / CCUG 17912 / NBRC 13757 / NCIMB 11200 / NRRL B-4491 / Barker I) TaxID=579138 RepID=F8EUF0_ZYMMT|nr:ABC-type transport auxiliary lipoprotein family protein [Zymomonas mobilis]AEI37166.1 protein of unknown function DUF330 [Zymomonas mobilis subsp. pomaceae ATCC 29192]MDX5948536.1 ABC-type transport auxiliary lipoprotein family protein [Zymomonas mobilis subsp. pomaceae]GEB89844.1 hypothetical protein ZMO02_14810 [Zymomonas mobilis subsp. pomaceae]